MGRFKSFLARTNLPGLSHSSVHSGVSSSVWLTIGVVGMVFTFLQMKVVLQDYLNYPVLTQVEIKHQTDLDFPAVTVCSFSVLSCQRLSQAIVGVKKLKNLRLLCILRFLVECPLTLSGNYSEFGEEKFDEICSPHINRVRVSRHGDLYSIKNLYGMNLNHNFTLSEAVRAIKEALPLTLGCFLNRGMSDLVAGCKFSITQRDCTKKIREEENRSFEFTDLESECRHSFIDDIIKAVTSNKFAQVEYPTYTPMCSSKYGGCIMINMAGNLGNVHAGAEDGLTLVLRIREKGGGPQVGTFSGKEGMGVRIVPPGRLPTEMEEFQVAPNTVNLFALERETRAFQKAPHKANCLNSWDATKLRQRYFSSDTATLFTVLNTSMYDSPLCGYACQMLETLRECNCIWDEFDPHSMQFYLGGNANKSSGDYSCFEYEKKCQRDDPTVSSCLYRTYLSSDEIMEKCGCHVECERSGFNVQTSHAKWPSDYTWQDAAVEYDVERSPDPKMSTSVWRRNVQESLAKVIVYYRSSKTTQTMQVPKYKNIFDLLTALGGSMSVWIGVSLVSLIELAEAFLDTLLEWWWDRFKP